MDEDSHTLVQRRILKEQLYLQDAEKLNWQDDEESRNNSLAISTGIIQCYKSMKTRGPNLS